MSILFISFLIILSSYPLYALLWWIVLISYTSIFILSLGLGIIAFTYFILYIGAIVILFLFVIMTLHNTFYLKYYNVSILAWVIALYSGPQEYIKGQEGPFLLDVLPSLAYPIFTNYSFLWYPCTLLLLISLLFPIHILL